MDPEPVVLLGVAAAVYCFAAAVLTLIDYFVYGF